jgi:hypothetical protein
MNRRKVAKLSPVLALLLLLTACSGNFSSKLRLVLLAAPPLIQSLPLSTDLKSGLITDFTDMGDRTATLGECLNGAASKPAKLVCVQTYEPQIETIIARGHFGNANNERLNQILGLIRGIIASARIFYGEPTAAASTTKVTERSIRQQVDELNRLMKP